MSTANEPDYYRILNVHHQADSEIIEAAYQALREKFRGAPAAERDIEAAYAILIDPERRAGYDARRRAAARGAAQTSGPATIAPRPEPAAAPDPDRQTVPGKCSLTGQGFEIVLLRAKGPLPRYRVIGFEPWPADAPRGGDEKQNFFSRLFRGSGGGGAVRHPLDARPGGDGPGDDGEYLEFSKFDFAGRRCPICDGEAGPAYGGARHWVMCGRCNQILCMGGADDAPSSQAITCPWCGTTLRFGAVRSTGGRVRASNRPPSLGGADKPKLPPGKKALPKG